MREFLSRRTAADEAPFLSFGSWGELPAADPSVVVVCHPDWRGVRTAAYTFRTPVVEAANLDRWGESLVDAMGAAGVDVVVVHGFPPGTGGFLDRAHNAGLATRLVLHSSMAQHGAEAGEAAVADEALTATGSGALDRIGFVKSGLAESFRALGYPASYVPNRSPELSALTRQDLGGGLSIGVFAEPFWRKNVVTQLGAVAMIDGATAHVMRRPAVGYLGDLAIVEHGEDPWDRFLGLQASTDLNLYVTLSECHPLSPVESYLSGVPALVSRTSALFRDDPRLWELTTAEVADDPSNIAAGSERLLANSDEAIALANRWIERADADAADRWGGFVAH